MKFAIALLMLMCTAGVAEARTAHAVRFACPVKHSKGYCSVKQDRHAIKILRGQIRQEVHRTHSKMQHFRPMRKLTWNVARVHKVNLWHRRVLEKLRELPTYRDPLDVAGAIHYYFGKYFGQAWTVTKCESTHSIYDQLGQYLGLFQMGDYARSAFGGTYGRMASAWTQSKAAWGYFSASGYDWSPWSCKPDGSVRYPG